MRMWGKGGRSGDSPRRVGRSRGLSVAVLRVSFVVPSCPWVPSASPGACGGVRLRDVVVSAATVVPPVDTGSKGLTSPSLGCEPYPRSHDARRPPGRTSVRRMDLVGRMVSGLRVGPLVRGLSYMGVGRSTTV